MAKFTIPQGREFEGIFVIKEPNSGTPLDLTGASGTFTLSSIGVAGCVVIDKKAMGIFDAINGKFKITLTADETADLETSLGLQEDGYPLSATYKALLDIDASVGKVYVRVPQIYVESVGDSCPVS